VKKRGTWDEKQTKNHAKAAQREPSGLKSRAVLNNRGSTPLRAQVLTEKKQGRDGYARAEGPAVHQRGTERHKSLDEQSPSAVRTTFPKAPLEFGEGTLPQLVKSELSADRGKEVRS